MSATLSKRLERPKAISQSRPARHAALWTLSDVLTCALAISIGVSLLHGFSQSNVTLPDLLESLVPIPCTVALLAVWGSYRSVGVQWNREIPALLASTVIGSGLGAALAALWASDRRPTAQFLSAWVPMLPVLLLGRLVRQRVSARTGEEELPG
jgi:hypothetical protein